jgi:hypothetical protein
MVGDEMGDRKGHWIGRSRASHSLKAARVWALRDFRVTPDNYGKIFFAVGSR